MYIYLWSLTLSIQETLSYFSRFLDRFVALFSPALRTFSVIFSNSLVNFFFLTCWELRNNIAQFIFPSAGREKSIIVNLENIKAIVTANEVLLLDPLRPQVLSLIDQLKKQFPQRNVPEGIQYSQEAEEGFQSELPFEFQVLESAFEVVCSFLI